MNLLNNVKILPKLATVIALIGVVMTGCIWFAQSRMTTIDDAYSLFVNREAKAVATARRTNRLVFELNYWVYRVIAETEDSQMKSANQGFVAKALNDLREQAPSFLTRIEEQTSRINEFVKDVTEVRRLGTQNQNAEAIALVHRAIDPTFAAMVEEGNRLARLIHHDGGSGVASVA